MAQNSPIVRMEGITKRFPGVVANDQVTFALQPGEILALLGENGAGKSTLMNILYGIYQPDEGQVWIDNERVKLKSPADAIRHGIGMIHQEFMLVPPLTVAENVVLGREPRSRGLFNRQRAIEATAELSERYRLSVEPEARVFQLSVGEQQRVEILKVLYRGARVLIMDEPTAVLTPQETTKLFDTLQRLVERDHSVIFITHKMREVFAIADRVLVLRDGKVAANYGDIHLTNRQRLANDMVDRPVHFEQVSERPHHDEGEPILRVESLSALNDRGVAGITDVALTIQPGEVLGVAGVEGNGQHELVEVIAGLRQATAGRVVFEGNDITDRAAGRREREKIAYIPSDRRGTGAVMEHTVVENLMLGVHGRPPLSRRGFIRRRVAKQSAQQLVKAYNVRCPGISTEVRVLSGGNLQKLILARELDRNPKLILAAHPTRGLDINAAEYIHRVLLDHRDRGAAILFISTELDELFRMSDRIIVMYEGRIMATVRPGEVGMEEVGMLMAGEQLQLPIEEKTHGNTFE